MYAVVRTDLGLTGGAVASQAGHAFLESFVESLPQNRAAYFADGGGTKVVLAVDGERRLREIFNQACAVGLPCSLIVEEDGTMTAVGIGPATRGEIEPITRRLSLMR